MVAFLLILLVERHVTKQILRKFKIGIYFGALYDIFGGGKEEPGESLFLIVFTLEGMAYFEMDDDFNKRFILYNNAFRINLHR